MSLKLISKLALAALVALSLSVLSTAARAGDGNIAQQSSKGDVTPPAKQFGKGKNSQTPVQSQSYGKGKGDMGPVNKGKAGNKSGFNSGNSSGNSSGNTSGNASGNTAGNTAGNTTVVNRNR
jgi:hypothetical protein